ncbi:hypothetical protein A3759_05875 [Thalassolituus sp. HI0120]|nr:hypothetical protein A3759_05875 [Thalassolituus sp. HI0120]
MRRIAPLWLKPKKKDTAGRLSIRRQSADNNNPAEPKMAMPGTHLAGIISLHQKQPQRTKPAEVYVND